MPVRDLLATSRPFVLIEVAFGWITFFSTEPKMAEWQHHDSWKCLTQTHLCCLVSA